MNNIRDIIKAISALVFTFFISTASATEKSLLDAATEMDIAKVHELIASGADITARNSKGATALHIAAFYGNAEMTEALLKAGADANATTATGITPLHLAATMNPEVITLLLDAGANRNLKNASGATALDVAITTKTRDTAHLLNDKYSAEELDKMLADATIIEAIKQQDKEKIQQMLKDGSYIKNDENDVETINTALKTGNTEIMQILLDAGLNVNAQYERNGFTALINAVAANQTDMVLLLIKNGADVNLKNYSNLSPMHNAVIFGNKTIIAALLDAGAITEDDSQDSPLDLARLMKRDEIIKFIEDYQKNK